MSNPFLVDATFSDQPISILATYDSFSLSTGSLLTDGGLGVKLSAHIGEQLTVNSVNITPSLGDIIFEKESVLTANTLVPATVSDFLFYNDITQTFKAIVSVHVANNLNNALDKNAIYTLNGILNPSGWILNSSFTGDVTGIKFSIIDDMIGPRAAGSILYTNPNDNNTTTTVRFRAHTVSPTGASNDADGYVSAASVITANTIDYTVSDSSDWISPHPSNLQGAIDTLADRMANIKIQYEYHVSKSGNDSTGNGSYEKPFLTISAAISAANNEADNDGIIINIGSGQYNENLTIIKPNITLKGAVIGSTKTTRINGRITINPRSSTGGMYANYYTFENMSIVSSSTNVMEYTGSHTGNLYMSECMLYTSTAGVKGLVFSNTTSMKVNVFRCDINIATGGNSNAIYTEAGSAVIGGFYNCNIYGKSVSTISINGTTNITFSYCYIDNTGTDIVELKNSVVAYFSYCTFANYQLNSNGFNISTGTSLVLSHCIFNIPTNVVYNPLAPGSPPATTVGYVVKGPVGIGSNIVYGSCLFAPVTVVGANYYWGTKAISNTVNTLQYNTTFTSQA